MTLSVVHFSTADNTGGSGRSAYRIHTGLRRLGHQSHMLVGTKDTSDKDIETTHGGGIGRIMDRLAEETTRRLGLQYQYYPSSARILRHPWVTGATIIQLYNSHGGYFSHRLLPALSRIAPIVWRLSDMWPITGHCAYAGSCENWRDGCSPCPDLASYPPLPQDFAGFLWRQKKRLYARSAPTIVAPSSWIEGIAKQSPLFAGCAVHRIPNGLDLSIFRPMDRQAACTILNIDPSKPTLLFSAHVVDDNPRKGSGQLIEALNRLGPLDNVQILLAGIGGENWHGKVPQTVIPLGFLGDDRLIAAANCAADVVLVPSAVENLPNSIIEAMACGRPVVAYDAGGIRDAVVPGDTGLLVPVGNTELLANAIQTIIETVEDRTRMGMNALTAAQQNYDAEVQAKRFESLYQSLARS